MATYGTYSDIGHRTSVAWNSNTYYLISMDGPSGTTDAVETTHSGTTDYSKTFMPGLNDEGEITLNINFNPDEPAVTRSRTVSNLVATFPPKTGQTNGATFTCSAFVTAASVAVQIEGRMTQTVTWKLSGVATWADGA